MCITFSIDGGRLKENNMRISRTDPCLTSCSKELGGSLTAYSQGQGLGAIFTLELPCQPPTGDKTKIARDRSQAAVAAP
jgi:hypothetical protein